jgi:hypothetical protein
MNRNAALFVLCVLCNAMMIHAQPDPNTAQHVGNMTVWRDYSRPSNYYYLPGKLELAKEKTGEPALKLILIRYSGNVINRDEGASRFRSLLQMRVKLVNPTKEELAKLKTTLRAANLYVLPISKVKTVLVLPSLAGNDTATSAGGYFEQGKNENASAYWDERDFTVRLDNYTAQYVMAQLDSNRLLMSLAYAFYVNTPVKIDTARMIGSGLKEYDMANKFPGLGASDTTTTVIAKADAIPIQLNLQQWPTLVTKIDMNSKMPPAYACLDLYCYDFNNEIRTDLYSKMIQVKAKGIANDDVIYNVNFSSKNADIYAAAVRFKYAVRVDLPYYYRVTEVTKDGETKQTDWIKRENWYEMLDITSRQ